MKRNFKGSKTFILFLLMFLLLFSSTPVFAQKSNTNSSNPTIFEQTIAVTQNKCDFKIGFATVSFKKDFMDDKFLPETFTVKIYAENGKAYIDFEPSTGVFNKEVKIHAENFEGYLYDIATKQTVYVKVHAQTFFVPHFSRYCFNV